MANGNNGNIWSGGKKESYPERSQNENQAVQLLSPSEQGASEQVSQVQEGEASTGTHPHASSLICTRTP